MHCAGSAAFRHLCVIHVRRSWESECGNLGAAFDIGKRVSHAKSSLLRCARAEFEALTKQSPSKVRIAPVSFEVGRVGRFVVRLQGTGKTSGKTAAKGNSLWPNGGKGGDKGVGKGVDSKGKRPHEASAEQLEAKRAKCVPSSAGCCTPCRILWARRLANIECRKCGKLGHYADKCPS